MQIRVKKIGIEQVSTAYPSNYSPVRRSKRSLMRGIDRRRGREGRVWPKIADRRDRKRVERRRDVLWRKIGRHKIVG